MVNYYCHEITEVSDGLFVSGILDVEQMVQMGMDVLVPLAFLNGNIWNTGFRGEILYYPIEDYGVLPDDILERLVEEIIAQLESGKRVGLFCSGGHGRTGYVAACVLIRQGVENPISYLRGRYCRHAVESQEQWEAIRRFMENQLLRMEEEREQLENQGFTF